MRPVLRGTRIWHFRRSGGSVKRRRRRFFEPAKLRENNLSGYRSDQCFDTNVRVQVQVVAIGGVGAVLIQRDFESRRVGVISQTADNVVFIVKHRSINNGRICVAIVARRWVSGEPSHALASMATTLIFRSMLTRVERMIVAASAVRIIEHTFDDPQRTGHDEVHRRMTNLFDAEQFPALELVGKYHER